MSGGDSEPGGLPSASSGEDMVAGMSKYAISLNSNGCLVSWTLSSISVIEHNISLPAIFKIGVGLVISTPRAWSGVVVRDRTSPGRSTLEVPKSFLWCCQNIRGVSP
jgi:hypothetical protein